MGLVEIGTRGLELEVAGVEEEANAEEKDKFGSLIKVVNVKRLPTRPKNTPIPKGCVNGTVGLPMPASMRIP